MFERELTLYKFTLNYLRLLAGDFEDDDLGMTPYPGANPPVWILGHLAVCTDFAGRILGLERACPREWHACFAPGTRSAEVPRPWPTKGELLSAIEHGHQRVSQAAPEASAEAMAQPHTIELLKPTVLKTFGDVLAHLLSTHEMFHIAQLSACRRSVGKAPIV